MDWRAAINALSWIVLLFRLGLIIYDRHKVKIHKKTIRQLFSDYIQNSNEDSLNAIRAMPLCQRDLNRVRRWRKTCLAHYAHNCYHAHCYQKDDLAMVHRADEVVQLIKSELLARGISCVI